MGVSSFSWNANVEHGTSIVFMMADAIGRQGGASDVTVVANSNDQSCLNSLSPSSTYMTQIPTQSEVTKNPSKTMSSSSSSQTLAASSSEPAASGGSSVGAIAGTVVGVLLFLAVVVTLGIFFLKKRREAKNLPATTSGFSSYDEGGYSLSSTAAAARAASLHTHTLQNYNHTSHGPELSSGHAYQPSQHTTRSYTPSSQNLAHNHNHATSFGALGTYEGSMLPSDANPFLDDPHPLQQHPPANLTYQSTTQLPSTSAYSLLHPSDSFDPPTNNERQDLFMPTKTMSTTGSSSMVSAQRKAASMGVPSYQSPSHIIVHTDAEDDLPLNVDGIVELPPQYTERHVGRLAVVNQSLPSPPANVTSHR